MFSVSGDDNGNSQAEQADRNVGSADLTSEGTSAAVKTAVRTEKKASEGVHKKNSAASTTKSKGRKKKKEIKSKSYRYFISLYRNCGSGCGYGSLFLRNEQG